MPLKIHYIQN